MSALLFAEICAEAGLPAGVFNVITGNGAMGQVLAEHPDVDKVGFTGSTGMVKHTNLIFFDNALRSFMNALLSQQSFWHCHKKRLVQTIRTIPHYFSVSFKLASLYSDS